MLPPVYGDVKPPEEMERTTRIIQVNAKPLMVALNSGGVMSKLAVIFAGNQIG